MQPAEPATMQPAEPATRGGVNAKQAPVLTSDKERVPVTAEWSVTA
jgi:hypothetical protein